MTWLVTGAGGMLGRDVVGAAQAAGQQVIGLTRADLDVTLPDQVEEVVGAPDVEVVLNCAGWTDVDGAEEREADALRINGDAVANLARACRRNDARLLHLSTDYVFQGDADSPYAEDAPTDPLNAYGRTKLAGERAVLQLLPERGYVVRTAWLYGEHGPNFVRTMLRLERERDTLNVVDDQVGQPTWTVDLARQLVSLAASEAAPGIYHGTSSGSTSWHGFAAEIFRLAGADPKRVHTTDSSSFQRPAARPAYSVLGHNAWTAAGLTPLRPWQDALAEALPRIVAAG